MEKHTDFVDFAGNDYLGLARDVRLIDAAHREAVQFGISASSSRWGLGWTELHERLELGVAEFLNVEASCLLSSAYLGGLVYFVEMAPAHDTVFCDELSHTNLTLGMKAAGFDIRTYKHLDADDLARQLDEWNGKRPIIATDAVFGISGELAPLAKLRDLAREYNAELLIDDAHGLFAMGQHGRGASEMCGLSPGDVTILGSLSKALGSSGGFLAGRSELVERFRRSDPSTSATPLPIPIAAASLEALRIVGEEPQRREQLNRNATRMREILSERGISVASHETPIVAMLVNDAAEVRRLSDHFLTHGLRIPHFDYPSNPNDNLLRSIARSCHTPEQLQRFANAVAAFSPRMGEGIVAEATAAGHLEQRLDES